MFLAVVYTSKEQLGNMTDHGVKKLAAALESAADL